MSMTKQEAIRLLGGTVGSAAKAVGIRSQAVSLWPDDLPNKIEDRVIAAYARQHFGSLLDRAISEIRGTEKAEA